MSSKNSEAKAKVSLDSSSFEASAKAIAKAAQSMSGAVTAAFATAGTAMLAAFGAKSAGAIFNSASAVLTLGEDMANAGKKAGIAAGQFYLFTNAMEKGLSQKTMARLLGDNAEELNRSAAVFRDVSIKLWAVGEKIKGFWLGLMARVSPILSRLLDGALANSLVSAGNAFGDAIANTFKTIYTLAQNGELWETLKLGFRIAFEYGAKRMLWLANVGYEVLSAAIESALTDGLSAVWDGRAKKFGEELGESIGDAFFDVFVDIVELINGLLVKMSGALQVMGLMSAKLLTAQKEKFGIQVETRKQKRAQESEEKTPFSEKLTKIFEDNKFEQSEGLKDAILQFSGKISSALADYEKTPLGEKPAETFENNFRKAASGADSLSSIGGGGGVYLGLTVLDVQKSQLAELQAINRKLSGSSGPQSALPNYYQPSSLSVTRAQTLTPVK